MVLDQEFDEALKQAKELPAQSNENLLKIYSLYKQATEGDVSGDPPTNPFDIVGNAKYKAWSSLKGISTEEAKKQYVDLIKELSK
jgi:acyl-CoA-binding protein